jgi:hypothetical protein
MDKLAGLATQVRDLKRRLKEMDTKKANPAKIKEITDVIKDLEHMLEDKKQKQEERRKKKEEAAKSAPVEATTQPEVAKESAPITPEVTKESTVEKFAIDSKVEPIRGTPGSWGTVIREAGVNGDPLVYVKWNEGPLKTAHGDYGAYYPSDLRLKAEVIAEAKDPTAYVPREQLYNLEADLKSNYEQMIADLQEEIKTATDKGEAPWAHRLQEKLDGIQKAYQERFEKIAEDENGSGGTEKLRVVDLNPTYDKDPQEKATGYGGDRAYGWQTAPVRDDMTSLNASEKHTCDPNIGGPCKLCDKQQAEYERRKLQPKEASLKVADLDLNSLEKRYAIYLENVAYPAARTLTYAKAQRIAKEKFPKEFAAGKVQIKREDYKEAELKPMNINVGSSFYNVNPLPKPSTEEFAYDVLDSMGKQLFKITAKQELDQEHISKIIETELGNKKEASKGTCRRCKKDSETYNPDTGVCDSCENDMRRQTYKSSLAKLTSNLAFLKKGSFVSILAEDKIKGQIKFASLDNSLRGWAPISKFAAMDVPEAHLIDHDGHKDEVLADNGGKEILVTCPANSVNVEWRTVEAPPATPESLNPDVTAAPKNKNLEYIKKEVAGPSEEEKQEEKEQEWADEIMAPHQASQKKADEEYNEPEADSPEQSSEDIYIHDERGQTIASSPAHGIIAKLSTFNGDWELFYTQIRDWMEANNFFPSVWTVSDHGNIELDTDWIAHVNKHPLKNASLNKNAHIRHEGDKWVIYSHDYKKKLGEYPTEAQAKHRLSQIEMFKHMKGSLVKSPEGKVYRVGTCNFETDMVNLTEIK